jgi:hypothetical protein
MAGLLCAIGAINDMRRSIHSTVIIAIPQQHLCTVSGIPSYAQ